MADLELTKVHCVPIFESVVDDKNTVAGSCDARLTTSYDFPVKIKI